MIQLALDRTKLNDNEYMLGVINTLFMQKVIEGQTLRYKQAFDFYMGLQPTTNFEIKDNYVCKVVNLTKPIVDTATETFIGELPDITTSGKKAEKEKISKFTQ
ncbi:MAG: hypothetical protein J6T74_02470 [Clostridia bacterium]|nr:hypothetical protein [Clostridia bacterium]